MRGLRDSKIQIVEELTVSAHLRGVPFSNQRPPRPLFEARELQFRIRKGLSPIMKSKTLQVLGGVLLAGSFAFLAAKIVTDYDHHVDFSNYKTYSWMEVKAGDPLWVDRIKAAVDAQLTNKGWSKAPGGAADASVAAFGSTKEQPRIETFYDSFGGGWFWHGFGDGIATTEVDHIEIGTLVVDIFDTPTKHLIWRGVASDTLSDKPEKNEKKLEKNVAEMLKNFPPKPKG
jgi:hypothetical protein